MIPEQKRLNKSRT